MNIIVLVICMAGVVLLLYALIRKWEGELRQQQDEKGRPADEPPLLTIGDKSWLTPHLEPDARPKENVTPSLATATDTSHCPACGATITANDEKCPSCEIRFVADGAQKWTLKAVGPADGIFRPSTDVSE